MSQLNVGQPVLPDVVVIGEKTLNSFEPELLTAPYGRGSLLGFA